MKIRAQSFVVLMALVCLSSLSGSALMQATQKNNAQQSSAGPSAANAGQSNAQKPSSGTCELNDEDYAVFTAILKGLGKPEDPEEAWKGKEILVTNVTGQGTVEKKSMERMGFSFQLECCALRGNASRL
jgi:hypothetical protein